MRSCLKMSGQADISHADSPIVSSENSIWEVDQG